MDYEKLGEPFATLQARVDAAREIQRQRFLGDADPAVGEDPTQISCNEDMHPDEVRKYCQLDDTSHSLIRSAVNQLQLYARAYHRLLKLSRTITDMAGENQISPQHLAEALQYRPKLT